MVSLIEATPLSLLEVHTQAMLFLCGSHKAIPLTLQKEREVK